MSEALRQQLVGGAEDLFLAAQRGETFTNLVAEMNNQAPGSHGIAAPDIPDQRVTIYEPGRCRMYEADISRDEQSHDYTVVTRAFGLRPDHGRVVDSHTYDLGRRTYRRSQWIEAWDTAENHYVQLNDTIVAGPEFPLTNRLASGFQTNVLNVLAQRRQAS